MLSITSLLLEIVFKAPTPSQNYGFPSSFLSVLKGWPIGVFPNFKFILFLYNVKDECKVLCDSVAETESQARRSDLSVVLDAF